MLLYSRKSLISPAGLDVFGRAHAVREEKRSEKLGRRAAGVDRLHGFLSHARAVGCGVSVVLFGVE